MVEKQIKALIRKKGLTQKAVAEKAGYTENAFSHLIGGREVIKDIDVYVIAQALGVTPNDLYKDPDEGQKLTYGRENIIEAFRSAIDDILRAKQEQD